MLAKGGETRLSRWSTPLLYRIDGNGAKPDDAVIMAELAALFKEAARLDIRPATQEETPNFTIAILTLAEQTRLLAAAENGEIDPFFTAWLREPLWPCVGVVFSGRESGAIQRAHIVIRDQVTPRLRRECFAEETAQAMGLLNDSRIVRPSLFNDDQEFSVLTDHDVYLMRVLYDPRLSPAMTLEEAAPIAAQIIEALRPDGGPLNVLQATWDAAIGANL